jgi:hypothetical protein
MKRLKKCTVWGYIEICQPISGLDTVVVRTKLDSSIEIIWKDKPLLVKELNTLFDQYK